MTILDDKRLCHHVVVTSTITARSLYLSGLHPAVTVMTLVTVLCGRFPSAPAPLIIPTWLPDPTSEALVTLDEGFFSVGFHKKTAESGSQLRRRILGQSAFAISRSPVFVRIRRAARQEELAALQARFTADADYKSLAEEYFEQVGRQETLLEEQEGEIAELRNEVTNLRLALRWKDDIPDAVEPDAETPPATVEEAVLAAVDTLQDALVFGAAVNEMESVRTLAADAGPPDKILRYLRVLAEFTRARREGPLGTTAIKWLEDAGVTASPESDRIRNSPKEQAAALGTMARGKGARSIYTSSPATRRRRTAA